jgi:pimeloyl-ACP methyl ester carboxylesterase
MDEFTVPAKDDSSIRLYVRNKRPEGLTQFSSSKTVVFVHGATYPAETACDLALGGLSWMDHIARRGFDVYLLDLRGYGKSTRPKEMEQPAENNEPIVTTDVARRDVAMRWKGAQRSEATLMQQITTRRKTAKLVAYHEAGHAVIARRLGVPVCYVALFPTESEATAATVTGRAVYEARCAAADPETLAKAFEVDGQICLAGPYSDFEFWRRHRAALNRKRYEEGWEDDRRNAETCVGSAVLLRTGGRLPEGAQEVEFTPEQAAAVTELWNRLKDQVQTLVARQWSAIERTAQALLGRGFLWDHELDAIIAGGQNSHGTEGPLPGANPR